MTYLLVVCALVFVVALCGIVYESRKIRRLRRELDRAIRRDMLLDGLFYMTDLDWDDAFAVATGCWVDKLDEWRAAV